MGFRGSENEDDEDEGENENEDDNDANLPAFDDTGCLKLKYCQLDVEHAEI